MTKTVRVRVTGKVQGVGFRAWTAKEAKARRLSGWVRNRRDGTVEAILSGDGPMVDAMLDLLRHGPSGRGVDDVEAQEWTGAVPDGFLVTETA
ncbi:acylphosphatase [Aureimonas endophytica]|uniref:Acylphosphatase n=1 Tax=Aureimonas endophytica TaxID=2027858 RepID=A0A917E0L4_9HYPH|nr:acylphosphatase [Aureimonas endophytica]GGD89636.1 acylphosphatase [Aureimonas endophytica]